jgi:hypothetical protein
LIETDACEDVTAADAQRQTKQNHYFDASEHDPEAAGGGEGTAQRFRKARQWPIYFWTF